MSNRNFEVDLKEGFALYLSSVDEIKQVGINFNYHAPKNDQQIRYEKIRSKGKELAELLLKACPNSRERSLALTKIEEAIMWANASIARNE